MTSSANEVSARASALNADRYHFLDGLRGLFSVVVLLFHVIFVFYEPWMPTARQFGLFFNGPFAVYIFFIISGFSLTIGYFRAQASGRASPEHIIYRMAAARYARLAIPCLAACLLMYVIMISGLNYFASIPSDFKPAWWGWAYREYESLSLKSVLRFSLYDIFFPASFIPVVKYEGPYLITNLWTMSAEFVGSMIVFIYAISVRNDDRRVWVSVAITIFLAVMKSHYVFFFAGVIAADLFLKFKDRPFPRWAEWASIIFIVLAFAFARPNGVISGVFFGFALVVLISLGKFTREIFGSALFRYLGSISFALYLVHMPVVVSLQSYLYLAYVNEIPRVELVALSATLTILASFVLAHLFSYIDRYSIGISHKMGRWITGEKPAPNPQYRETPPLAVEHAVAERK